MLGSPSILGNAGPRRSKRGYYVDVVGATPAEFAAALSRTPTLCNYSVEKRVAPRRAAMLEAGLDAGFDALLRVVKMTDPAFSNFLAREQRRQRVAA